MSVNKKDIVKLLETIAIYMELKGENPFKVSAFRKAAAALEGDERSMSEMGELTELKGIGKGTAGVIQEFMETGQSTELKELQEEVPSGLIPLLQLPGMGGKKIAKLYKELGVEGIHDLEEAAKSGKIRDVAGFGKKSEEKILAAIENFGTRPDRLSLAYMLPVAELIESYLQKIEEIEQFSKAGACAG